MTKRSASSARIPADFEAHLAAIDNMVATMRGWAPYVPALVTYRLACLHAVGDYMAAMSAAFSLTDPYTKLLEERLTFDAAMSDALFELHDPAARIHDFHMAQDRIRGGTKPKFKPHFQEAAVLALAAIAPETSAAAVWKWLKSDRHHISSGTVEVVKRGELEILQFEGRDADDEIQSTSFRRYVARALSTKKKKAPRSK